MAPTSVQWNTLLTWVASAQMMPQSARIFTTTCLEPTVLLEDCQREYGRTICSASPQRSRYTELSLFQPICMVQRPGFSTRSRKGYLSGFTNARAACTPSLTSNGKTMCQMKKSSVRTASLPSVECAVDICMPKAVFFSELQEYKHDHSAPKKVLQRPLEDTAHNARNQPSVMAAEASDRDSWHSSV